MSFDLVGRYALGPGIASGGMARVHLGRLVGPLGFSRTVAIKRLHPHLSADPTFAAAFADEAHLAARIRHPNVVPTLDVVHDGGELLLVMEYVDGEALSTLARGRSVPLGIAVAIASDLLHGLHSAHEARDAGGRPLEIVHRDVSPQNVLVGADGVARLVDFGIARANGTAGTTGDGELKGKIAYMSPEQIRREPVTRRSDLFSAGIVLWELLTGQRLFAAEHPGATIEKILVGWVPPPSSVVRGLPPELDAVTLRALDPDPAARFESAHAMAVALEDAARRALGREVAAWVEEHARTALAKRRAVVAELEALPPAPDPAPAPFERDDTGTQLVVPVVTPPRRRGAGTGLALVAFAATLVLFVFGQVRPAPRPPSPEETEPAFAAAPPIEVTRLPGAATATAPLLPPPPSVAADAPRPPVRPPPSAPPVRRVAKPRPRVPCVAKVDPVTQKKTYQGDCD